MKIRSGVQQGRPVGTTVGEAHIAERLEQLLAEQRRTNQLLWVALTADQRAEFQHLDAGT